MEPNKQDSFIHYFKGKSRKCQVKMTDAGLKFFSLEENHKTIDDLILALNMLTFVEVE